MPRKPQTSTSEAPLAPIPSEILDQFVGQGPLTPEELDAVVRRFKKAIIERALGGELTHHLGYAAGRDEARGHDQSSQRDEREDGADRRRSVGARCPARSRRHVRAALDRQTRAPLHAASTTR